MRLDKSKKIHRKKLKRQEKKRKWFKNIHLLHLDVTDYINQLRRPCISQKFKKQSIISIYRQINQTLREVS